MNPDATALHRVLELSRAMLAAAQGADWARLIELEAERSPMVMQSHPAGEAAHRLLGEILACDGQLAGLVGQARDAAARQWQQETNRAQAIAAYAG